MIKTSFRPRRSFVTFLACTALLSSAVEITSAADVVLVSNEGGQIYISRYGIRNATPKSRTPIAVHSSLDITGIELTSADTGWMIVEDRVNGTEVSLRRLHEGIAYEVTEFPTGMTRATDLAFCHYQEEFFFLVPGAGGAGCLLGRVDQQGRFQTPVPLFELGSSIPANVAGLATDPADGALYSIDLTNQRLVRLDTGSGVCIPVNQRLGIQVNKVRGLDFTLDGGHVLHAFLDEGIHSINTRTGWASQRPIRRTDNNKVFNFAACPTHVALDLSDLRLGTTYYSRVSGGPGGAVYGTTINCLRRGIWHPRRLYGEVRIDFSDGITFALGRLGPGGDDKVAIPVPQHPLLLGMPFYTQSFVITGAPNSPKMCFSPLVTRVVED